MSRLAAMYDHAADVLYVAFKDAPSVKRIEIGDFVYRYGEDGELVGVTFIGIKERAPKP